MKLSDGLHLERRLGKGGMGMVWVARNSKLDTEVAVKFIEDRLIRARPESLERFKREARVAAQLSCPHVVRTQDYGALGDGTPYLVMELLKGESLQQRLCRGPLSVCETVKIVSQTALALQEAHERDIVHRDIKPANLFLQRTRYDIFVKLLDFGIAKDTRVGLEQLTQTGSVLGSPRYMSPEQLANDADWRADLWSLAAVAYRCLAGRAPFAGDDLIEIAQNVLSGRYEPASQLVPALPKALDDWFAQAFHEDIEQRFQSAEQLARCFGEAMEDGGSAERMDSVRPERVEAAMVTSEVEDSEAELCGHPEEVEPPPESLSEALTLLRTPHKSFARRPVLGRHWLLASMALLLGVMAGLALRLWPTPPAVAASALAARVSPTAAGSLSSLMASPAVRARSLLSALPLAAAEVKVLPPKVPSASPTVSTALVATANGE